METSFDITVQALAGMSTSGIVSAYGYGIYNNAPVALITVDNTISATAIRGSSKRNN